MEERASLRTWRDFPPRELGWFFLRSFPPGTAVALWQKQNSRYDGSYRRRKKKKKTKRMKENIKAHGGRQIVVQIQYDIRVTLLSLPFSSPLDRPNTCVYMYFYIYIPWQIRRRTNESIFITRCPLPLCESGGQLYRSIRLDSWRKSAKNWSSYIQERRRKRKKNNYLIIIIYRIIIIN